MIEWIIFDTEDKHHADLLMDIVSRLLGTRLILGYDTSRPALTVNTFTLNCWFIVENSIYFTNYYLVE